MLCDDSFNVVASGHGLSLSFWSKLKKALCKFEYGTLRLVSYRVSLPNSIQVSLVISRWPVTSDAYHNPRLSCNVRYSQRYSFHTDGHDRRVQKRLYTIFLCREIVAQACKGAEIVDRIIVGTASWSELFAKHDFFFKYKYYLQVIASTANQETQIKWCVNTSFTR